MKKEEKIKMILRQLNEEAGEKERTLFSQWLLEHPGNLDLYVEIKNLWETKASTMLFSSSIAEKMISTVIGKPTVKLRLKSNWRAIAAIALLLITVSTVFFVQKTFFRGSETSALARQITRTSEAGEQLCVILPDGSTARLNSQSSIQFPEKFSTDHRNVKLTGEAFFEVSKDPTRPFIIQTNQVTTTVLGTSFNVKAFDDNEIAITVATGRVKVETHTGNGVGQVFLNPNERAICCKKESTIKVEEVNSKDYYAWTEGIIRFNNDSLEEVIRTLVRWYNKPIKIQGLAPVRSRIKGSFKDKNLNMVLDGLCFMYKLNYRVNEDNSITITSRSN